MPHKEYRFTPVHYGMEMMAQAQNQSMLFVTTNGYRLHGFASRPVAGGKGGGKGSGKDGGNDGGKDTGAVQLWLINKYDGAPQKVKLVRYNTLD